MINTPGGYTLDTVVGELGVIMALMDETITHTQKILGPGRIGSRRKTRHNLQQAHQLIQDASAELTAAGVANPTCYTDDTVGRKDSATRKADGMLLETHHRLHVAWYGTVGDPHDIAQTSKTRAHTTLMQACALAARCANIPPGNGTLFGSPPAAGATLLILEALWLGMPPERIARVLNVEVGQLGVVLALTEEGWPFLCAAEAARLAE